MKINITPNLEQIRAIALSAQNAWRFQSLEDGRNQVIADMKQLVAYLDALDNGIGVVVAGVSWIEKGIRIERSTRESDIFDLSDRYMSQNTSCIIDVSEHDKRPLTAP
jgi:hypothetical protein